MRALPASAALIALMCAAAPLHAGEMRRIDIPPGPLSERVAQLSRQAGVSISVTSEAVWRTRVRGVRGTMTPGEALARMLSGTRSRAVQLSATSWRIEAGSPPMRIARADPRHGPPVALSPAEDDAEAPIIVTASKIDQPSSDFAGTVDMLDGGDLRFGGERGTDSIVSRLASVASTHLGPGRNKLFIRGIADSSFTGPTQATVGQYLGDLRLSYNAPDPDLRLQDINRVEVLEGSQGTLYGAGSLGGIIRLVPNDPDPRGFSLETTAGVSLTQHGDPGGDLAVTLNAPFGNGRHALRVTAYGINDGGYIDNPLRGERDVNRTRIGGGRAAVRLDAGDAWTVDIGGIYQLTGIDDAQYADRDGPPLTRSSPVTEDADAHYGMGMAIVRKDWGDLLLQSSNAYVDHRLDERFDASRTGGTAALFEQDNRTRMWVSETRLWRPVREGFGWVIGFSAIDNRTEQRRAFEGGLRRARATGVTNRVTEFTGYGKISIEPLPGVLLSGGGRVTHSRLGGSGVDVQPNFVLAGAAITAERTETELLPSAELLIHAASGLSFYARYEEGFRPGGLAIEADFVRRFRNDHVQSWEGGARWGSPRDGIVASLALAHVYWRDIQADFIDGNGLPSTANIGNGRITSVTASLSLRPTQTLSVALSAVYNHSRVVALTPEVARLAASSAINLPLTEFRPNLPPMGALGQFGPAAEMGRIPNVADYAAQGSIDYRMPIGRDDLRLGAWFKYVGPSRLGVGPRLGDEQGNYLDTGVAARLGDARRGLTLSLTNLFDAKGNRFALGTPFDMAQGAFITPQRPRTLRVAFDYRY
ncbi:MAG: TonB-dependent receptor [Sphingobium sp. 66-54]|nr:MAG: TonB-dependent receptor [Sphingobium sp. 66-54]